MSIYLELTLNILKRKNGKINNQTNKTTTASAVEYHTTNSFTGKKSLTQSEKTQSDQFHYLKKATGNSHKDEIVKRRENR